MDHHTDLLHTVPHMGPLHTGLLRTARNMARCTALARQTQAQAAHTAWGRTVAHFRYTQAAFPGRTAASVAHRMDPSAAHHTAQSELQTAASRQAARLAAAPALAAPVAVFS